MAPDLSVPARLVLALACPACGALTPAAGGGDGGLCGPLGSEEGRIYVEYTEDMCVFSVTRT
jgi:hypothetical protein